MEFILKYLDLAITLIKNKFNVMYVLIICQLTNIKIGRCLSLHGIPLFKKEGGNITIGNKCSFRSRELSNYLGINHRCILFTYGKGASITIGDNCGFSGTTINTASQIKIGNNVRCGSNSMIMGTDGHFEDVRSGGSKPIVIEDGVWVGSNSVIMKGVTIGRYAMIGANTVCRCNVPAYAIVFGNPSKLVGFSKTPEEIVEHEKKLYSEAERLSIELLEKNYKKYFISRLKEIKEFTKL